MSVETRPLDGLVVAERSTGHPSTCRTRRARPRMTTSDHSYSLLITDDDRGARETLREIFEPVGFRTLLAESGEEAIDIAQSQDVHLALMDMHLPRLTGL